MFKQESGDALQYATEELRGDREVVMEANVVHCSVSSVNVVNVV